MLGRLFGNTEDQDADGEILWSTIAQNMPEGFAVCELIREDGEPVDYRQIYANPAWAEITGLDPDAVSGVPARQAFPALEEEWRADFIRAVVDQRPLKFTRQTAVTGATYDTQVFPVSGDQFAILIVDISRLKKTETELKNRADAMARRLTGTVSEKTKTWEVTPNLLAVIDLQGLFDQVNPAWKATLGYDPDEISGRSYGEFLHPDDVTRSNEAFGDILDGTPAILFENRYRHADGSYRWLSWVAVLEGERVYCSARDITELKSREVELERAEEALRQSQKMEVIGQLTGGIAHDFNNLLMAIRSSVSLARKRIDPAVHPKVDKLLQNALKGVERGAGLTQHMLAFARKQDLKIQPLDAAEMIRDIRGLVERAVGPQIRVDTSFIDEVPKALADATQLEMAILNLAINAKDAMDGQGVLNICVDTTEAKDDSDLSPGRYVLIRVTDEGQGMDAATLAKATEPFFTTKETGQGTGLGLSMIQGLAEQSGGTFRLSSEVGVGTTADILLPTIEGYEETSQPTEPSGEETTTPMSETKTVLAVDDDFLVLVGTEGMLEDLGHTVITVESGKDALDYLARHDDVDVVITDQAMPEMTGTELAKVIRTLHPNLPVVLATGYTDDVMDADTLFKAVIGKPFGERDLADALAAAER